MGLQLIFAEIGGGKQLLDKNDIGTAECGLTDQGFCTLQIRLDIPTAGHLHRGDLDVACRATAFHCSDPLRRPGASGPGHAGVG